MSVGSTTPKGTRMMWKASVNAICERAGVSSTGDESMKVYIFVASATWRRRARGAPRAHPLQQVIAYTSGVCHRGQGRVHRPDARHEAGVDDVEVVDLVCTAVGVEN